jgi:hypothetical protein
MASADAAETRETGVRILFFLFECKGGTLNIGSYVANLSEREACPARCSTAAQSITRSLLQAHSTLLEPQPSWQRF